MFIKMDKKAGVKLLARERVCAEDINVFPVLQDGEAIANGTYQVGDGYAGFGTFKVDVPPEGEVFEAVGGNVSLDFGTIGVLIDGENYSAYEGMTWAEWLDSEYNTVGLVNSVYYIGGADMKSLRAAGTGNIVLPSDTVVIGGAYYMAAISEPTTSITIDGVSFSFDEGMTWAEWISSDYNTLGLVNYTYYIGGAEMTWLNTTDPDKPVVLPSDTIEVNGSYVLVAMPSATAISEEDTAPVSIVYDGRIVASLTGSQRATLHCKDKVMKSDVVVTVPLSSGGGGVEMNVAFGNTAPDDTGKLWIRTAEPESVGVKMNFDFVGNEQLQAATLSLPSNVYQSCAAAVGKKIYVFGGSSSYSDKVYVYDTETNGIEQSSATLPSAVNGAACAAIGKRIYIFGGRSTSGANGKSAAILVFDTETSTFETLSIQLPADRYRATAAAVGNKIYIFGGSNYNSGEQANSTVYLFNAESNAITSLTTRLPTKAYSAAAVAVGSKIYVFGGYDGTTYLDTISVFDTETQTLAALEDVKLPIASQQMEGAAVGSVIYLFGGRISSSGSLNTIVRFNAETHGIETLGVTMPKNTWETPAVAIGSKIYAFDGTSSAVDPALHTFTVHIDLPENHMLIEASGAGNTVRLFPNLEIGVKNVYLGNADGKGVRVPAALYKDGAWTEI